MADTKRTKTKLPKDPNGAKKPARQPGKKAPPAVKSKTETNAKGKKGNIANFLAMVKGKKKIGKK